MPEQEQNQEVESAEVEETQPFSDDVLSEAFNADNSELDVVMNSLASDSQSHTDETEVEVTEDEAQEESAETEEDAGDETQTESDEPASMLELMEEFLGGLQTPEAKQEEAAPEETVPEQRVPEIKVPIMEPFKLSDSDAEALGIEDTETFEKVMTAAIQQSATSSVENFFKNASPYIFQLVAEVFPSMSASAMLIERHPEYENYPRVITAAISKVQRERPDLQSPYRIVREAEKMIGGHMEKAEKISKQIKATDGRKQFAPKGTRPRSAVERKDNSNDTTNPFEKTFREMASAVPSGSIEFGEF